MKKDFLRNYVKRNSYKRKLFILLGMFLTFSFICKGNLPASTTDQFTGSEEQVISDQNAQQHEVKGKVSDSNTGEPLPGVNITVQNTTIGTVSDLEGNYTLQVDDPNVNLVFSYVGYLTETIPLQGQTEINITMIVDILAMEEIVVIGYGTIRKSDLTGAVASVKPEQIQQMNTYDVQQAIQGRVSGVMVTSNTGAPGDGVRIRIRGIGTINNSDPLYVVDGFPTDNIDYIAPADIESLEILKDASATAIYGNRGANGVVLITTKKGKEQETSINFDMYTGSLSTIQTIPVLDAKGFAEAKYIAYDHQADFKDNERFRLRGSGSDNDTLFSSTIANNFVGTDWQDAVLRQGSVENYSLNISGGSESYKYYISGNYYHEEGIIKNAQMKRYLLRYGSEMKVTNRIKGEFYISYLNQERTNYDQSIYGAGILPPALYADPISPVYRADSSLTNGIESMYTLIKSDSISYYSPNTDVYHGVDISGTTNPVAAADRMKYNIERIDNIVANVGVDIEPIKGLTLTSRYGINTVFTRPKRYTKVYDIGLKDQNKQSTLDERHEKKLSWNNSNYITYTKDIDKHSMTLMGGQEWQYFSEYKLRLVTFDVPDDPALHFATASPFSTPAAVNQDVSPQNRYEWESSLVSFFGRLNYAYDRRYLLTATLRRDASSKMAEDYRWGNFPSVSVGWNIKNESFLENINLISALKFRGGWGKTGNEGSVDDVYGLYAQVTPGLWMAGEAGQRLEGAIQTVTPNERLQWEEVSQLNLAVDFGLMSNKLTGTIDVFSKKTTGMIVGVPPPVFTGTLETNGNIGEMENKGIEIALNYRNYDRDFKYEIGGNITFLEHPKVIKLAEEDQEILKGEIKNTRDLVRTIAGEEVAHIYGHVTDGLLTQEDIDNTYVSEEPGDTIWTYPTRRWYPGAIKIVDLNGDGSINSDDKTNIGSANPDFIYGFNIDLMYKGFDLRAFFQGVYGNEMVNTLNTWLKVPDEGDGNLHEEVLNGWTPENPNTTVPKLMQGNMIFQSFFNDYIVEDASYLRLKIIQLGYTLPESMTKKAGISRFRIYVSGENLLTITDYSGFDPEVGNFQYDNATESRHPLTQGLDDAIYPMARRLMFGLNLSF